MNANKATTIAGLGGFVAMLVNSLVQSNVVPQEYAPIATAAGGLAVAILGFFSHNPKFQKQNIWYTINLSG